MLIFLSLLWFISLVGFCSIGIYLLILLISRKKNNKVTTNKIKKFSLILLGFTIGVIALPVIISQSIDIDDYSEKEIEEKTVDKTSKVEEKKKDVSASKEKQETKEESTEEFLLEDSSSEEASSEDDSIPDDDKTPEQLQNKVKRLLNEHLYSGSVKDVQFYKDSIGANLMIEIEPILSSDEDTIKEIMIEALQSVSYTDAEYDSVKVSVIDEDGTYIGKIKLGNDGIYSIRNNNNETDFENLELFAEEEITIEPN